jgi:octaprenyl-diphosphate synthase
MDIRERKLTLPIIYTLNNSTPQIRRELVQIIKNKNEESKSVKKAIQYVFDCGGIEYSTQIMNEYASKALNLIEDFPESDAKASLKLLVNYTMNREK